MARPRTQPKAMAIRLVARLLKPFKLARYPMFRSLYRSSYRALIPDGDAEVCVHGLKMCVDPHDSGVGYQLYIGRAYESLSTELFRAELRPGMHVIDLGANIGYYALLSVQGVGPSGRVWAFEPEPENFGLLEKSVARNALENVRLVRKAASDRTETVTLRLSERGKGLHTIGAATETWGGLEIEAVRLDEYLEDELQGGDLKPDLIKMDIEGAEPRALAGMSELLRSYPGCRLFTELHPGALARNGCEVGAFLDQLAELGRVPLKVVDEEAGTVQSLERAELIALCALRPTEVKDWSCNVLFGGVDAVQPER